MEYAFSIFMFIFAGALLLYAGLLALTRDYNMLPYRSRVSVKPKNPEKYTAQIAKAVALTALATALGGLAGFWDPIAGVAVLIAGLIVFLWLSTKLVRNDG